MDSWWLFEWGAGCQRALVVPKHDAKVHPRHCGLRMMAKIFLRGCSTDCCKSIVPHDYGVDAKSKLRGGIWERKWAVSIGL